jgi:hypothetical protein
MQAGLPTSRRTFREIFSSTLHFGALQKVMFVFLGFAWLFKADDSRSSMAA